jgi:hypothetical protein
MGYRRFMAEERRLIRKNREPWAFPCGDFVTALSLAQERLANRA